MALHYKVIAALSFTLVATILNLFAPSLWQGCCVGVRLNGIPLRAGRFSADNWGKARGGGIAQRSAAT